jgi:hypothetical protein
MVGKAGLAPDHFYVQECKSPSPSSEVVLTDLVGSQKAYGMMRTHCTALSNVHDKHDVHLLSDHKRECLKLTIQAAAFLVGSIGNGGQATNAEYGTSPSFSMGNANPGTGNHYFRKRPLAPR